MSALKSLRQVPRPPAAAARATSQEHLTENLANELFIGFVGPGGSGSGQAAMILKEFLETQAVGDRTYEVHILKASTEIKAWARKNGKDLSLVETAHKSLDGVEHMQNLGDEMRLSFRDNAAVARAIMARIRAVRATASGRPEGEIDGKPRAYLIESLRHPSEAQLLRRVYQDAFTLVGVVCEEDERRKRLIRDLFGFGDRGKQENLDRVSAFMARDADAPASHGQHVIDTFHEADFFVDNSKDAQNDPRNTAMNEPLRRLVRMLTASEVIRPKIGETAMHQAHSAQLRSACLSRQVGAALVDAGGNVVSTGANDVPKAGGGLYGADFDDEAPDHRCAYRPDKFCSSNREQNAIIGELIDKYPALSEGRTRPQALGELRRTKIGGLIEFSRAVHAEMDAILAAARTGTSPRGCRLYVSTFPCHYCARHIVAAGIDEVQYIEPYPKSQAIALHCDAITTDSEGWEPPSQAQPLERPGPARETAEQPRKAPKVLFHPFVGVAPRMYARVFLKDRDYKDKATGDFGVKTPAWGGHSPSFRVHYLELESGLGELQA
ncbi:anti-phage dCTP deaminase [Methylobacterium oryzae]|uniref:anti-phage dCTP deaminase n=1 Tax=Methylobacterium oryzae TaxID=334852 RepID=UPI001F1CC258|nr:anti-phage dCTP deaminase [Methylobacterium oryzae]UIN36911.1 deaminase [Methylobacterium oryzae]